MAKQGIFCIETSHWEDNGPRQPSVESLLALIQSTQGTPFIHRDFSTEDELEFLLTEATQTKFSKFPIIYLASHGGDRQIWVREKGVKNLKRTTVSLDRIAAILKDRGHGKVIVFSACALMKADGRHLKRFIETTKVKAIMGYKRNVGWIESAQLELSLLGSLAQRSTKNLNSIGAAVYEFESNRGLMKHLQFRLVPKYAR